MNKITLSHFTEKPFTFDPNFNYEEVRKGLKYNFPYKCKGIWLSDENDCGWKDWCHENDFHLHTLKHETKFELDLTDIIHLDSREKLKAFDEKYKYDVYADMPISWMHYAINWNEVAKDAKGILISPYRRIWGHNILWHDGWDCSSACIWDLSCLTPKKEMYEKEKGKKANESQET